MKKKTIVLAILCLFVTTVFGQTYDYMNNTTECTETETTVVTITKDNYGSYFLESKTETDSLLAKICIGYDKPEAKRTIELIKLFVKTDDLIYTLIEPGNSLYLQLFKEENPVNGYDNFITNGTETVIFLPKGFTKKANIKK